MLWGVFDAEAHPRSCGEHARINETSRFLSGSSPLARGTHHGNLHPAHGPGLIPARAGNTGAGAVSDGGLGAHPRSRGEHYMIPGGGASHLGSSPLAQGITFAIAVVLSSAWAHPRSRREHERMNPKIAAQLVSSPLARGTLRWSWG